jgi:hypothetical protein
MNDTVRDEKITSYWSEYGRTLPAIAESTHAQLLLKLQQQMITMALSNAGATIIQLGNSNTAPPASAGG